MESRIIEHLGGLETIKKESPQVWEFLKDIKVHPSVSTVRMQANPIDLYLSVDELFSDSQGIHSLLRADYGSKQKIFAVVADIYDADNDQLIDTISKCYEDIIYQECNFLSASTQAKLSARNKIRINADFTYSEDGVTAHEQTVVFELDEFANGEVIIDDIQVTAPRAKNGKRTIVLYDREPHVTEKTDYHYTNVMLPGGKSAKFKMPFEGKVTVAENYEIDSISTKIKGEEPKLCVLLQNGDGVNYSNVKTFAAQCVISADKKSVSWKIDDDWNAVLDLSHFKASTTVAFSCVFSLIVKNKDYPLLTFHPKVMITSVDDPQPRAEGAGAFEIEKIDISWGCVAEDTMILLEDGSEKPISDIRIGDRVSSASGSASVKNVYRGQEQELVNLTTLNGKTLRMTESHPVQTTRGLVKASMLNAADTIITVDGESPVQFLYKVAYESDVYNLELEPAGNMICNGIIAGDFEAQNRRENKMSISTELDSLQKEFRRLFDS